jgi:hypothetical protein
MATENIITQIWAGAVKDFDAAEAWIEGAAAKIKAVLPASATAFLDNIVSDVKQGASDALGSASTQAPATGGFIAKSVEQAADAELATLANGAALPLVPIVNSGIDDIVARGVQAFQAWALKAKAELAANSPQPGQ